MTISVKDIKVDIAEESSNVPINKFLYKFKSIKMHDSNLIL